MEKYYCFRRCVSKCIVKLANSVATIIIPIFAVDFSVAHAVTLSRSGSQNRRTTTASSLLPAIIVKTDI